MLPVYVNRFVVLMYLSLILDAVSFAFVDRTAMEAAPERTVLLVNFIAVLSFFLFMYLIDHAAFRRKAWPRRVLVATFTLSVISVVQVVGIKEEISFRTFVDILSCALTGSALYYSYSGDARGWFTA